MNTDELIVIAFTDDDHWTSSTDALFNHTTETAERYVESFDIVDIEESIYYPIDDIFYNIFVYQSTRWLLID